MAAHRHSLLRTAEGLALAALGGVMLWLPLAGNYWYFLHPRFKPLTGGAGAALLVLGLFAALAGGRPRVRRLLAAAGSVALVLGAYAATLPPEPVAGGRAGAKLETPAPVAPAPRVEHAGRSYLRMNLAELQTLTARGRPSGRVAVRGLVRRSPDLDAAGRFALLRPVVVCCLADMVAAGYVVQAGGDLPPDNSWAEVLGETRPSAHPLHPGVSLPGVLAVGADPARLLVAHLVRSTPRPDIPFIFTVSEREPYAW